MVKSNQKKKRSMKNVIDSDDDEYSTDKYLLGPEQLEKNKKKLKSLSDDESSFASTVSVLFTKFNCLF